MESKFKERVLNMLTNFEVDFGWTPSIFQLRRICIVKATEYPLLYLKDNQSLFFNYGFLGPGMQHLGFYFLLILLGISG